MDLAPGERLMTRETVAEERPRRWASSFKLMEGEPAEGAGAAKFLLALAMECRGRSLAQGRQEEQGKEKKVRKMMEREGKK